jgi:hypothetical protein
LPPENIYQPVFSLQASDKHADGAYLLEDGSILDIEYESEPGVKQLLKYGHYAFRLAEHLSNTEKLEPRQIRILVVYTGDVESSMNKLDLGGVKIEVSQVFLRSLDADAFLASIRKKLHDNLPLTDVDIQKLILAPLGKSAKTRQKLIEESVNVAKEITDVPLQKYVVAKIIVAIDKFVDESYSRELKGWLGMTQIGKLYDEEKRDAVRDALRDTARKLLLAGDNIEKIMQCTSLEMAEIEEIQQALLLDQA